ncbi:inovirus-type Gp2 protein [Paraburkholderia sp. SUR17]|uniref:inovirus-type Gp2 protein n=1 Tax=Paraburkholderia sp. SUR17 TaxID=3034358 RepID=UPI00240783AC|nr:inovirus-type Gp2 protein [Paraburkholderia sp. SUR17]WEY37771.1 inovirus-type Gp2 protein [Paraburkholderia sp. SUR17]
MTHVDNPVSSSLNADEATSAIYWSLNSFGYTYADLVDLVNIAVDTDYTPFAFDPLKPYPVRTPVSDGASKHLGGFLPKFDLCMDLCWPGYYYSPDFRLFFDVLSKHPIAELRQTDGSRTVTAMKQQAALYNRFIADLRQEGERRNIKKQLSDWRGGLTEQARSVRELMVDLRVLDKRLIPMRVDLYYSTSAVVEADAMPRFCWGAYSRAEHGDDRFDVPGWTGSFEVRARIDSHQAMEDRARFFDNRKGVDRPLFDSLVAYVCKIEVGGRHRANHFHALFLFDADRVGVQDLVRLYSLVEQRWRRVTGGVGLAFHSRDREDVQRLRGQGRWALDALDCRDEAELAALEQHVLGYLVKDKGQTLRVKPSPKAHTFVKGLPGRY